MKGQNSATKGVVLVPVSAGLVRFPPERPQAARSFSPKDLSPPKQAKPVSRPNAASPTAGQKSQAIRLRNLQPPRKAGPVFHLRICEPQYTSGLNSFYCGNFKMGLLQVMHSWAKTRINFPPAPGQVPAKCVIFVMPTIMRTIKSKSPQVWRLTVLYCIVVTIQWRSIFLTPGG